jgi:aminopeptidase N
MDEGLISFLPRDVERTMLNQPDPMKPVRDGFQSQSGRMNQMPLMVRSYAISNYPTYRLHAYTRGANAFSTLRNYLGHEVFHQALRKYIQEWAFKHPTPYDFFYLMEQEAGEDLGWFWRPWFFELNYPDLAIERKGEDLVISNPGGLPLPVELIIAEDDKKHTLSFKASVWQDQQDIPIPLNRYGNLQSAWLVVDGIPDADATNNQVHWDN